MVPYVGPRMGAGPPLVCGIIWSEGTHHLRPCKLSWWTPRLVGWNFVPPPQTQGDSHVPNSADSAPTGWVGWLSEPMLFSPWGREGKFP